MTIENVLILENIYTCMRILSKLGSPEGSADLQLKLYNKYIVGIDCVQVIEALGKGLNKVGLFDFLKSNDITN